MKFSSLFACFTALLLSCSSKYQGSANAQSVVVAFYNCENLFDINDDPGIEDEEFTPGGKYHYTQHIYEQKLHNISSVIAEMGNGSGPVLLGLAEVENAGVLQALCAQPVLAPTGYKYEITHGQDTRGINVALVYDPSRFRKLFSESLTVDLSGAGGKSLTRDVLHVKGILKGDTVDVFVNHWPSRRGGEDESAAKREIAARVNKAAADALLKKNPAARIIIMGDLNDNPTDNSITGVLGAQANPATLSGFYDPWIDIFKSGAGTESYRKSWNLFDQIILSGAFTATKTKGLHYRSAEVFKPAFIIDQYKGHEGEPHRSFVGTRWINGFSDHFPVQVFLN